MKTSVLRYMESIINLKQDQTWTHLFYSYINCALNDLSDIRCILCTENYVKYTHYFFSLLNQKKTILLKDNAHISQQTYHTEFTHVFINHYFEYGDIVRSIDDA